MITISQIPNDIMGRDLATWLVAVFVFVTGFPFLRKFVMGLLEEFYQFFIQQNSLHL